MINDDPLLLDYHRTARRFQLSERKVRELVASGELPAISLGRSRRVRAADLDAFVDRLGNGSSREQR